MAELGDVRALYEAYIAKVEQLVRDRKPGEGVFGLKGGPKDDPCHDRFAEDLGALLKAYAREEHTPAETRALLEYIYTVPLEHREPRSAYWMLMAVHGLCGELVERLTREDAGALRRRYAADYPPWERLPVQKKTLDALKKQAK